MLKRCVDAKDVTIASEYIEDDYIKAPYLYNNIDMYGIKDKNVDIWIDYSDDNVAGVYLRYFSCLHMYSKHLSVDDCLSKVKNNQFGFVPQVIMFNNEKREEIPIDIKALYDIEIEYIFCKDEVNVYEKSDIVKLASIEELSEVASLMYNDVLYQQIYKNEKELFIQLTERYNAGYGKCYIIYKDEKIVASCTINAENSKFGIIGGIIVDSKYRKQGLGKYVCDIAWNSILDQNKKVIDLVADDNCASIKFHESNGFKIIGSIYKLKYKKGD